MSHRHSLMNRQLKRYFGSGFQIPPEWAGFVDAVNDAYSAFDTDRQMLERSIELSSQELLQANSELRAVFQAIPDLLFRLDQDGRILDYKASATVDLLLQPMELLGKRIQDVPVKQISDQFRDAIQQVQTRRELVTVEYCLTLHGRPSFYEARLVPLLENQIVAIIRNITQRKQAEAEREILISELEAKNSELERFSYTVSHDLKSPLLTIRGFLGHVEQAALAGDLERMRGDISRIVNATQKMDQLLGELLELSRVGRLMNPPEAVPFEELARETLGILAGRLAERHVTVMVAPGLPAVWGDRVRLREVLQNLLDNAVKFLGDQPRPQVEIGARRDGEETAFFVRDNGMGIEPRYHARVFGLFEKLNPRSEGTGVGLALVKRIVEVHGGRIWVESDGRGTGCTICFTLRKQSP